ncbi:hypothetical protein FIBSPDRAFT_1035937 [Athelia psychrophila]|uniref:Uncharacterized protein n=1 Tax=Athelia psychrophila TaxID=1759441 RepID=A0A166WT74_9AGAM|nr:hypothetical protein FIBSPDRAFT_1035937 [Fibularhizoctonia sp. CBS 109695]
MFKEQHGGGLGESLHITSMARRWESEHLGLTDRGRKYFSQAVQMIAICRAVDLSKLDSREKREILESVHISIQTALDAVIVKKSEGGDSQDAKKAKLAAAVATLISHSKALGLNADEIQKTMDTARENDDKTAKRSTSITQKHQIKKNELPGNPIQLTIVIGMKGLTTGLQHNIHTDSFCEKHTLSTVLWHLIQRGIVKMSDNPHFYPAIENFSNHFSVKPWAFTQPLAKLEKLEDLQQRVTLRWGSQQRQLPQSSSRNKTHVIHTLMDDGDRVILKSEDGNFYKNIGNVWTTENKVTMLKDVCGILQPVRAIQNGIKHSHLYQHVSGVIQPVDIKKIWDERKDTAAMDLILYLETEEASISPIQSPIENVANPAQPIH